MRVRSKTKTALGISVAIHCVAAGYAATFFSANPPKTSLRAPVPLWSSPVEISFIPLAKEPIAPQPELPLPPPVQDTGSNSQRSLSRSFPPPSPHTLAGEVAGGGPPNVMGANVAPSLQEPPSQLSVGTLSAGVHELGRQYDSHSVPQSSPASRSINNEKKEDLYSYSQFKKNGNELELNRGAGRFKATVTEDGSMQFKDHPTAQITNLGIVTVETKSGLKVPMPGLSGVADITDAVMRMSGRDPYLSDKLRLMDRTREERAKKREQWTQDAMKRSLAMLPGRLQSVWSSHASHMQKRKQLFLLWDECSEFGEQTSEGKFARATVVGFIRRNLPMTSDYSYGTDELLRLNKTRVSKELFAPYAP